MPGIYDKVRRAERVKVRALNPQGEPFTLEAEGLLAVCIQHEIDHLEGKVFVEYLSRLKQQRIAAKLKKQQPRRDVAPRVSPDAGASRTRPMKIIFAGTPEFAAAALAALHAAGHEIALVLTQPDRPVGTRPAADAVRGQAARAGPRPCRSTSRRR